MKTIFSHTQSRRMMTLILCLLAVVPSLFAWGQKGHRIVAQVAYDNLTPCTRAKIDKVLGKEGMVFYANWGDEVKSDSRFPESKIGHFQDLPGGMTDSAVVATLTNYPTEGGVLFRQLDSVELVLRKDKKVTKGTTERSLRFFIHIVGDFFCPMHVGHLDDFGGNKVKMKWFGQNTNLHTVWDSKLIESQGWSYTEYAYMLECRYGHLKKEIRQKNRSELLLDNYRLVDYIYTYQETWRGNTYHYIYRWREPVELQLYTAGIRLAMLLNDIY